MRLSPFDGPGLALSLPTTEIDRARPHASVIDLRDLRLEAVSPMLRSEIELVAAAMADTSLPIRIVARPEMYTHGANLDWLRDKLGTIEDHVAMCDGHALRFIPGMENHFYFYAQDISANTARFDRLAKRVPEFLLNFRLQINTAYRFDAGPKSTTVPTVMLGSSRTSHPAPDLFAFKFDKLDVGKSVAETMAASHAAIDFGNFTSIAVLPLTDAALEDFAFTDTLGAAIALSYFRPSTCLILFLPAGCARGYGVEARLTAVYERLARFAHRAPRAYVRNIFCAAGTVSGLALDRMPGKADLTLHHTFAFWREAAHAYASCRTITVFGRRDDVDADIFEAMFEEGLGRRPNFILGKPGACERTAIAL